MVGESQLRLCFNTWASSTCESNRDVSLLGSLSLCAAEISARPTVVP